MLAKSRLPKPDFKRVTTYRHEGWHKAGLNDRREVCPADTGYSAFYQPLRRFMFY
jgi:cbb3-type cytochrome oxidase cytochrome c subunit